MRRFILLLSFLAFTQLSYGYSCPPPEFGHTGCEPKYFTLPQIEDSIHGIKGVTEEGKRLILNKILDKEENLKVRIDLATFPEEICREGKSKSVNVFKDGKCSVATLRLSLVPQLIYDKISGRIYGEGSVNTQGDGEIKVGFSIDL